MVLTAGCGTKQAQETTPPPAAPQVGIIDMNAAVKAHPQYKQLLTLKQQGDALAAQLQAEQLAGAEQAQQVQNNPIPTGITQGEIDELNKAFEQDYNSKLSGKQREADEKLASKAAEFNHTLTDEFNAYNDQLEKEYQPQIFNLQLKLKVVQLSKEDAAALQAELEKIQTKRSEALNVKHEELNKKMNDLMVAEKNTLEQEIATYRKTLDDEMSKQIAAKQAEILNRGNEQHLPTAAPEKAPSKIPEQLAAKQQEMDALQGVILDNITDKTAKVAGANGFEVVLAHVVVNVSAVDITSQVIAECNK